MTPFEIAQDVMDRLRQQAFQSGIELPERQLVYLSPVPADCSQTVVLIGTVNLTPFSSDGLMVCPSGRWAVNIGVVITRKSCAVAKSGSKAPTVADMERAAEIASADADMLMDFVHTFREVGTIELTMTPPNGGLQTVELNIQLPNTGNY